MGAPLEKLVGQEKNLRTLNAMFGKNEAGNIQKLLSSTRIAQTKAETGHGLELAIPLGQGGAILGLAEMGALDPKHRPEAAAGAAAILVGPRVLAKMMTNPDTVNLMLSVSSARQSNPWFKLGVAKLIAQKEIAEKALNEPSAGR